MRTLLRLVLRATILLFACPGSFAAGADQAEMDAACEGARAVRIEADKALLVTECVERRYKRDRAACERFYADHGAQAGNRAPLYYDLPECVRAFENRKQRGR